MKAWKNVCPGDSHHYSLCITFKVIASYNNLYLNSNVFPLKVLRAHTFCYQNTKKQKQKEKKNKELGMPTALV